MNACHASPMHAVIQPAEASTAPLEPYQALVAINTLTGEATSASWSRFFLMPLRFYLVTNRLHPGAVARLQVSVPIHDVLGQRTLPLEVQGEVRAEPGRERQIAEVLHGEGDLTLRMHTLLQQWVYEVAYQREASIVRSFSSHRDAMTALLVQRAQAVGLCAALRLGTSGEHSVPEVLCVGPQRIGVHLADCPDPQALEVRVDLAVDPDRIAVAHAVHHGRGPLGQVVLGAVAQLMTGVSLREYCDDLQDGVRLRLYRHLDAVVAPFGRRVAGLVLRGELHAGSAEAAGQLAELRREPHPFEITVTPRDGLDIVFTGAFSVLDVVPDAYRLFTARRPTLDVLQREVTGHARALLGTLPYATLHYNPPELIERMLNDALRLRIRAEFGLDIEVRRLERAATLAENEAKRRSEELIKEEQKKLKNAFNVQADRYYQELESLAALRARLVNERAEAVLADTGIGDIDRKIRQIDERIQSVGQEIGRHQAPVVASGMLSGAGAPGGVSRTVVGMLSVPSPGAPPGEGRPALERREGGER